MMMHFVSVRNSLRLPRLITTLLLLLLRLCLLLPPESSSTASLLHKLNSTRLASVLDPVQQCLVASSSSSSSNTSYQDTHRDCLQRLGLRAAIHEHAFLRLNQSAFPRHESKRSHCCTEDLPIAERQLDAAVEGFDAIPPDVVLQLLRALSLRNMSLVLAGDSMNAQLHSALLHEIRRQGQDGALRQREFSARFLALGSSRKTTKHGYHWWQEKRDGVARGNRVFIYVLDMWYGHQRSADEQDLCLRFLPALFADHPGGLLFVGNIGLHLEVERNAFVRQGSTQLMAQSIADFLAWLRHLQSLHPSSIVAFRESTPSHFPHAPDGSYQAWLHAFPSEKNWLSPDSGYRCRPSSTSALENRVAALILAHAPANSSRVRLVPVHDVLAPFYTMHYGNCARTGRTTTLDCVHLCAFAPQMFLPIWQSLLRLVTDASTSPAPPLPALPPYTTTVSLFRRMSDKALVACYNGICRVATSLSAVADELGLVFYPKDIRPVAAEALRQPFGRPITSTPAYGEGSVVRLPLSKQLFLVVENGTRRWLPSWEAFQALPRIKGQIIPIVALPLHAFIRLKEGPPMPEPPPLTPNF